MFLIVVWVDDESCFCFKQETSYGMLISDWSSDVCSTDLAMSGIPNWTHEIGGFAVEQRYTDQRPEAQAEWRELNLRWFQFSAFSPLFRSHGEFPHRAIYEIAAGDDAMYDSMLWYDGDRKSTRLKSSH